MLVWCRVSNTRHIYILVIVNGLSSLFLCVYKNILIYLYVYITRMVKEEQTKNLGGRFWTEEGQEGRGEGSKNNKIIF